jgi:hypothetical protein
VEDGLNFKPKSLSHDEFAEAPDPKVVLNFVESFIDSIEFSAHDRIIWCGWPVYWKGDQFWNRYNSASILMEPNAVLSGGIVFSQRSRKKLPTYYESIPGYEIRCLQSELGIPKKWVWEKLIEAREVEGTEQLKAVPNERFQLNPGTADFSLNVRLGGSQNYRFVTASLPVTIKEASPIVIHSEVRPTGGSVKIAIRPHSSFPDLFENRAEVALYWEDAEEKSILELEEDKARSKWFAHPFIIQSSGSAQQRDILASIAASVSQGTLIQHYTRQLFDLLKPSMRNGYQIPFGNRPVTGGINPDMEFLIEKINDFSLLEIDPYFVLNNDAWKWVQIGGCLFYYASDKFVQKVYEGVMNCDFPLSDAKKSSLFWSFGRVCREPEMMNNYLERALDNWDEMNGMHYWLFWPFSKSLCSYGEIARIDRRIAFQVFDKASIWLQWHIDKSVPRVSGAFGTNNWLKWTLSAILFGLRIREVFPDFLNPKAGAKDEVELANRIIEQLYNDRIYKTKIPPLALKGFPAGEDPPTLPELIIRFIEAKADDTDIELAGGIGLAS